MNNLKRLSTFLTISLILAGCTPADIQTIKEKSSARECPAAVPGEALLLLTEAAADGFERAPETASLEMLGVRSIERVFPDAGPYEERHRAAGLHRWYRVSYDPAVSPTKAGNDLGALPGVESVNFPSPKVRMSTFNDPYLYHQWGYHNYGQEESFVPGFDINVEPVWERYTAGSREVIVAVVDGGVDSGHEDLAGVVLSQKEGSRSFVYDYPSDSRFIDEHGTHVAGTIAAINNNGIGVCGIAGGQDGKGGVRIMSCAIFGPKDTDDGDDAAALVWAADHGAVLANNSWGYVANSESALRNRYEEFINSDSPTKSAIDYFIQYAGIDPSGQQTGPMAGGMVIFAAGNDSYDFGVPAGYDPVIAVGAFGPDGSMSGFSNRGPWVDLMAPGGNNRTRLSDILSTVPKNQYNYSPGTSMAAPHVTGVAALLVSYFGGPGFTNEMLEEALLGGSADGVLNLYGETAGGKLDAFNSFQYMLNQLESEKLTIATDYDGDWTVKSHETAVFQVRVTGNKDRLPISVESDCPGVLARCNDFRASVTVNALDAEPGNYSFTVRVGKALEKAFPFTILPNHAPVPVGELEDLVVNANSAATISIAPFQYFEDPDGEALAFDFKVSGDPILSTYFNPTSDLLTIRADDYGLATVEITAYDARQAKSSITFRILGRDGYRPLDVFPNPVTDWLHVRPGTEKELQVRLYNQLGVCVYEREAVQAGPFQPLDIDMQQLAGGVYTLSVNNERLTVTKL